MFPLIASTIIALAYPSTKVAGVASIELASRSFSLENRYDNKFVNDVFKYNILLTIKYMGNSFTLKPGEEFAFHDKVLPEYQNVVKTTNAHFNGKEGFKYDGDLIGDGVCHLASLIYWVAKDAGLSSYAPSNHNFAKINDVPKEYGVGILSTTPLGNLYITNNLDESVTFTFEVDGDTLTVRALVSRDLGEYGDKVILP